VSHDVAVVGAGHNGLICAAYLARAGLHVVVLEARENIGGCSATVEALGARVNICNCDHIMVRSTPIADELDLHRHGLSYLESDPVQLVLPWNGEAPWFLFHDTERTIDSLRLSYPDEVEPYRRYLKAALPAARLVIELANALPTPSRVASTLARRRGSGVRTLLSWGRRSLEDVLRSYFTSEALIGPAAVTGPALAGLPPHAPRTGAAALGYALRHLVPAGRPAGGSGGLTDALARSLEEAGGSVRTSARVEDILAEGARVRGVTLAGGEEVTARAVVVACDPRVPVLRWVGAPPAEATRLEGWRLRGGRDGYQSKLDAVIGELPRYRAVDAEAARRLGVEQPVAPTAVVTPGLASLADAARAMGEGRVPARPPHLVNIPSVLDPSMQPAPGEHVLSLESLFTPYELTGSWKGNRVEPERWLDGFATLVEPGFLESVRRWRAVTPLDYEIGFGQPRGQALSYGLSPLASVLGRERDLTRYETCIAGLFLTGVATYPGGGIWGAPGRNAAAVVERTLAA